MKATYYDGSSSKAREVEVHIAPEGLQVRGDEVAVTWPYGDLTRVGNVRSANELRLSPGPDRDERLVIAGGAAVDRDALERHAPHLFDRSRARAKAAKVVGGLVAFAVAIGLFVFVGLPALSGPLARVSPPEWETSLGASVERYFDFFSDTCTYDDDVQDAIDDLADRLTVGVNMPFDLDISIVDATFPNALAMPGGKIVVTDELLDLMDDPDQFAGVLAHEIAHVERRHVMAALLRDLGYGVLLGALLGGGSGAGQDIVILSGEAAALGYSRDAEREADEVGIAYMENAGLDPAGLAEFFDTIAELDGAADGESDRWAELLTTHPNSAERAEAARSRAMSGRPPAFSDETWQAVREACSGSVDDDVNGSEDEGEPAEETADETPL